MVKGKLAGVAVVVVSHRLSTIINAPRIIVFDRGSKVAEGIHLELLENSVVYRNLFEKQWKEYLKQGRVSAN